MRKFYKPRSIPTFSRWKIDDLESNEDLENSEEKYQNLLKLNNFIEKKFRRNAQNINEKTKEKILKITKKKDAKRIK